MRRPPMEEVQGKKSRGPSQGDWEGKISNARIKLRLWRVTEAKIKDKGITELESISCFATNYLLFLVNSTSWFTFIKNEGVKLNKTDQACHLKILPSYLFNRKNIWLLISTPVTIMLCALGKPLYLSIS